MPEGLKELALLPLALPLLLALPETDLLGGLDAEAQAVAEALPLPEALLLPAGLPELFRDTEGVMLACRVLLKQEEKEAQPERLPLGLPLPLRLALLLERPLGPAEGEEAMVGGPPLV